MDTIASFPDLRVMAKRELRRLQLGPWLRRLGRKQNEVAQKIGIGESYMSQLVSGKPTIKSPSTKVLLDLAAELGFDNPLDLYQSPPPMNLSAADLASISRLRKEPPK